MKAELQRIAIAKVCGWEGCSDAACDYRKAQHLHKGGVIAFPESYSIPRYPDYPNDLNAMYTALRLLPTDKLHTFSEELLTVLLHADDISDYPVTMAAQNTPAELCGPLVLVTSIVFASAAQQAEALLRTLGLWVEEV